MTCLFLIQLVYEIGDAQNYILPDVTCDFSRVKLEPIVGAEGKKIRNVCVKRHTIEDLVSLTSCNLIFINVIRYAIHYVIGTVKFHEVTMVF